MEELAVTPLMAQLAWLLASLRSTNVTMNLLGQDQTRVMPIPHSSDMTYPAIGIELADSDDAGVIDGETVYGIGWWRVFAITQEDSPEQAAAIARAIHLTLNKMKGGVDGDMGDYGKVTSCIREGTYYRAETDKKDENMTWQRVGGIYRLASQ